MQGAGPRFSGGIEEAPRPDPGNAGVGMCRPVSTTAAHDIIVVGGGLIGLSVGWRAARLGLDVAILERDEGLPGSKDTSAATVFAAGMLAPVTEATFGEN